VEIERYHRGTTLQEGHLFRDIPEQGILQRVLRAVAAVLLLVASTQIVAGQSYLTRSYTIDDGLPSPEVFGCAQDRSGRMWFTTRLHPIVYDGVTWELPQSTPGELGFTTSIGADEVGSIWLLSNRGSPVISGFDGQKWSSFPADQKVIQEQVTVTSFSVTSVPGLGTSAAIGTREHGLLLWREQRWQVVGPEQGLPHGPVKDLAAWEGRFYVATAEGLYAIVGDSVVSIAVDRIPPNLRNLLAVAVSSPRSGRASGTDPDLWLLTQQGLYRLDSTGLSTICQGLQLRVDRSFHHSIALDPPFSAYVGHQAGFLRIDLETGETEALGTGIVASGVQDLFVDREGNLWAATRRGVSKLVSQRFAGYRSADGLLEDEVTAICEPRPGLLVFGHNIGLTLLEDGAFQHLRFPPATFSNSPNRVVDLHVDRYGRVWIAALELGLGRLDPDGQLAWFSPGKGVQLYGILEEEDGGFLVSGETLFHFDGQEFRKRDWDAAALGRIRRMTRRSDGNAMIASDGAGLVILRDRLEEVIPGPDEDDFRSAYDAFEDSHGRIWLGTLGGLLVSDGDRLVQPQERQPQLTSPVYFITEDAGGDLWFGTDNGVVRWDGSTIRHYTSRDGLVGRETNRDAGFVDSLGRLWIGTESGVSRYQERLDRSVSVPPLLELLAVEVDGERLDPTSLPELGHRSSSIAFHFRGLSFVDEDAVTYRYYLEGFDPGWLKELAARQRSVRYTNLPPGTYTFHLQATNVSRVASKLVSSAPIVILEPIWKRWWFLLLATLIGSLVVLATARAAIRWRYALSLEKEVVRRRQTEKELARAYQLKSEFMANMSHEIRTPMNAVIGLTSLLLDTQLTSEQQQYVETVNTSASSLLALINEILDFSKIEAGMLELEAVDFNLQVMVEETCRALKSKADAKGLELRLSFATGLPQVLRGDQGRLRQILSNLLENAIKFTTEGWVSLQVALEKENGPEVEIRFVVRDTGIGIPEDKQETVFQAFAQADGSTTRSFGGAGLGLAIAKELCELSGGRIGLESEEGKGAKLWFTIRLIKPNGEQPAPAAKADKVEGRLPPGFSKLSRDVRVLIAEDDLVNQRVIIGTLAKMGFQADVVSNGLEAIRAVGNGAYDVVLMDVQMPEMDGLEATRQIRSPQHAPASRTVPIIAVTAFPVNEYRERCLDAGMDDFLTKPIHPAALTAAISRWVTPSVWASREASRAVQERVAPQVVFDHGGLLERLGYDERLVQELIEVFFREVPGQLESIEAAARDGDIERVQKLAHKLKGAAGSFGAPTLQAVAIEIGMVALGQGARPYSELVEQAGAELERLRQAVATVDLTRAFNSDNPVDMATESLREPG
jgi:signal transduction histidine kinase/CheY-like chemotaxis protein/ligand-binding sensor domain-containing protein/HPt (histidine-containing phosphotransfer) domain-containing protein